MLRITFFYAAIALVGCASPGQAIDRAELLAAYERTQFEPGVVSVMPAPIPADPSDRPAVVNWWYAGTAGELHAIVMQRIAWDATGRLQAQQQRYRIDRAAIRVAEPFDRTDDPRLWLALHIAVDQGVEPPADAVTTRRVTDPQQMQPADGPEMVLPQPIVPDSANPEPDLESESDADPARVEPIQPESIQ